MKKTIAISIIIFGLLIFFSACQPQNKPSPTITPSLFPSITISPDSLETISITPVITMPTPEIPVGLETPVPYSETIIDKENIKNIRELGNLKPQYNLIRMSENGEYLYKISDTKIYIYKSTNQDEIFQEIDISINRNLNNSFNLNNFDLNFSGSYFAAVTGKGIQVFSIRGELRGTFTKPSGNFSFALNPDGTMIAIIQNYEIQVFNVSDGKLLFTGKGNKFKFSPKGDLVGIQQTTQLNILELKNWGFYKDFPQDAESGWDFSPDGSILATIFQNQSQIYDLQNKIILKRILNFLSKDIAFSFNSKMIAGINDFGNGQIVGSAWNTEDFSEIKNDGINRKEWRFDFETILWKSGIEMQQMAFNSKFALFLNKYSNSYYDYFCYLSKQSFIDCNINDRIILSRQGNIWFSRNDSFTNVFSVSLNNVKIPGFEISKGFSFPATEFGKTMTEKNMQYDLLALDEEQKIAMIKKSADYYPAHSLIIDLNSGSILGKWTRVLENPVFSPDGHFLAFMYKTVLNIFDLRDKKIIGIREIGSTESLTFSKDGRFLAITHNLEGREKPISRVDILEVEKIKDIYVFPTTIFEQPIIKTGNFSNQIKSADYSNDNSVLIVGFNDGNISVIDPTNGNQYFSWEAHPLGGLLNIKFFPDGKSILTSGSDGSIKIWGLAPYYWYN